MSSLIPIPTTRVSNLLIRDRLLAQLQGDQLDIFRLQTQLSTGRRITRPSEDAPAALRAISLQRLLERKTQLKANVASGQSYLAATDSALNDVAEQLGNLRGAALGVAGTTSSETERKAVAQEVNRAIEALVTTGNRTFRGRYLFSGSQTNVEPYSLSKGYVHYAGDDQSIENFSDINVLFSTNAAGSDVFGGTSNKVLGAVNLNPQVTADTLLSQLRGGDGISDSGSIAVSDGTHTRIVDLSQAATVGDVARLIEKNPPTGRSVTVSITGSGLTLQLDSSGGGNLTVQEVGSGRIASELGILETGGVLTGPLVGGDLDPALIKTTPLDGLLGTKARARVASPGNNNDLLLEATVNGSQFNGAAVQFVEDEFLKASPGLAAGNEVAEYDASARSASAALSFTGAGNDLVVSGAAAGTSLNNVRIVVAGQAGLGDAATATYDLLNKRLTVTVDSAGATSVQKVIDAINSQGTFTAAHDDSVESSLNPAALVAAADIGTVSGNTGNSGGAANTLYVRVQSGVTTASQAAAAINAQGTFSAAVDLTDATTASQAGSQPVTITANAAFSGGSGNALDLASGIRIVNGGATYVVNFDGAKTVEDLLNKLNGSDAAVLAEINGDGTGINLRSRLSGSDFQVGENGGLTATQLGVRSFTGESLLADLNHGTGVPTNRARLNALDTAAVTEFTITAQTSAGAPIDLNIDFSPPDDVRTVQNVIDLINNHASNHTGGIDVEARLAASGNGIELVQANGRPLTVTAAEGSQSAQSLGLIPLANTTAASSSGTITGTDVNPLETSSVFTTLVRLRDALNANDVPAITRAVNLIDEDIDRVSFARSDVGARSQSLDLSSRSLQDEDVQLQSALSGEVDADLVEAISQLTARQASLEASLRASANILQLSLLNFL